MPKLPVLSGKKFVKIACNKYGFETVGQKGSHLKIRKIIPGVGTVTIPVPQDRELAKGTLRDLLRQACIPYDEFVNNL